MTTTILTDEQIESIAQQYTVTAPNGNVVTKGPWQFARAIEQQWGEWLPDNQNPNIKGSSGPSQAIRVGKKAAGRMLDGRTWDEFPDLKEKP